MEDGSPTFCQFISKRFNFLQKINYSTILNSYSLDELEERRLLGNPIGYEKELFDLGDYFYFLFVLRNYSFLDFFNYNILPLDKYNHPYPNWRRVAIDLEQTKKVIRTIYPVKNWRSSPNAVFPPEIRLMILLNLSARDIIYLYKSTRLDSKDLPKGELQKIAGVKYFESANESCSVGSIDPFIDDPNSELWKKLWIREINNDLPKDHIRHRFIGFFYDFDRLTNEQNRYIKGMSSGSVTFCKYNNKKLILLEKSIVAAKYGSLIKLNEILKDEKNPDLTLTSLLRLDNYECFCKAADNGRYDLVRLFLQIDFEELAIHSATPLKYAYQNALRCNNWKILELLEEFIEFPM